MKMEGFRTVEAHVDDSRHLVNKARTQKYNQENLISTRDEATVTTSTRSKHKMWVSYLVRYLLGGSRKIISLTRGVTPLK